MQLGNPDPIGGIGGNHQILACLLQRTNQFEPVTGIARVITTHPVKKPACNTKGSFGINPRLAEA